MIPALIASVIVFVLLVLTTVSLIEHSIARDVQHLKFDITFFCISLASTIVISHVLITNRRQIFAT